METEAPAGSVAILGGGNLGRALARGLVRSGHMPASAVRLTRRNLDQLDGEAAEGHPELAIDRVTTPNGYAIAGLNHMENRGFSSAMIRGIVTSSHRAAHLYSDPNA